MTRKHYKIIAEVLAEYYGYITEEADRTFMLNLIKEMSYRLKEDNRNFNYTRFYEAVGCAEDM